MTGSLRRGLTIAGYVLGFGVVAIGGIAAGHVLRASLDVSRVDRPHNVATKLIVGEMLPPVDLNLDNGDMLTSSDVVEGRGGVFLFIDPQCPPCKDMCLRWQEAIDKGIVGREDVTGIVTRSTSEGAEYAAAHSLTFSIATDSQGVFRKNYDVNYLPLEVVVGASGRIRSTSRSVDDPVDVDRLHELLTE